MSERKFKMMEQDENKTNHGRHLLATWLVHVANKELTILPHLLIKTDLDRSLNVCALEASQYLLMVDWP